MSEVIEFEVTRPTNEVVVPYSSRMRIVSWLAQRFQLRNRIVFWSVVAAIGTCVLCSSGLLLNVGVRLPIVLLSLIPGLEGPMSQFQNNKIFEPFNSYVERVQHVSPMDQGLRQFFGYLVQYTTFPGSEDFFFAIGLLSIGVWIMVLVRLFRTPALISVSELGLSLVWKIPFSQIRGPTVRWSDVAGISLKRQGGVGSPDGKLDLVYRTPHWQYKLFQPAQEVAVNKFSIDLRNFDTLEQRQRVGELIEKHATPNTVQPEVLDVLSATQSQAYTELWLQALTSPSKRQSLEPLPSGKELRAGKYLIQGQLGVGGQGTAYLAVSDEDGEVISLPQEESSETSASHARSAPGTAGILPASNSHSAETAGNVLKLDRADKVVKEFVLPLYVDSNSRKDALRKFLDEADLLKRLDNDRVVKLIDCFVEDHRGYLVLERIRGASLRDIVLQSGPMDEERVRGLLDQMIDVLHYLHSRQPPVVHRDFAPDNLILGDDGVLKLVDFNVAQQTENTMTGTIVGKQSYVPPEQLRGMATPRSDIYALGATLYFLLTGRDPEPLSVSHPSSQAPHVSEVLDELVAQCTQLDESHRLQNVDQIRVASAAST